MLLIIEVRGSVIMRRTDSHPNDYTPVVSISPVLPLSPEFLGGQHLSYLLLSIHALLRQRWPSCSH